MQDMMTSTRHNIWTPMNTMTAYFLRTADDTLYEGGFVLDLPSIFPSMREISRQEDPGDGTVASVGAA
jgi:hypothetical protein